MQLQDIRTALRQLGELADGWAEGETLPAIERDMALEKLRHLYEALLRSDGTPGTVAGPEPLRISLDEVFALDGSGRESALASDAEPPSAESADAIGPEGEAPFPGTEHPLLADGVSLPDASGESPSEPETTGSEERLSSETAGRETFSFGEAEDEPQLVVDTVEEALPAERSSEPSGCSGESVAEEESRPVAPGFSDAPEPRRAVVQSLFGPEDPEEQRRHRHKQRILMSLYDLPEERSRREDAEFPALRAEARVASAAGEEPEFPVGGGDPGRASESETPVLRPEGIVEMAESRPTVLGETIHACERTLGDELAAPMHDMASELARNEPVEDLRRAVGLNDRFLLIRDLFDGDAGAYERTLGVLNEQESLDDCLIYIAEHHSWNASSDGARLLMELLERKYAR